VTPQITAERRRTAVLLSLLVLPGAGHFLLGRRRAGVLFALPSAVLGAGLAGLFLFDLVACLLALEDGPLPPFPALALALLRARAWTYLVGVLATVFLALVSTLEIGLSLRREKP
jgi:hypothetical protein